MNKRVFEVCKKLPLPKDYKIGDEYIFFNYVSKKKDFKRPTKVIITDNVTSGNNHIMIAVRYKNKVGTFSPNTWTVFDIDQMEILEKQYFKMLSFYKPYQLLKRDLKFMSDYETKYLEHTI